MDPSPPSFERGPVLLIAFNDWIEPQGVEFQIQQAPNAVCETTARCRIGCAP